MKRNRIIAILLFPVIFPALLISASCIWGQLVMSFWNMLWDGKNIKTEDDKKWA